MVTSMKKTFGGASAALKSGKFCRAAGRRSLAPGHEGGQGVSASAEFVGFRFVRTQDYLLDR